MYNVKNQQENMWRAFGVLQKRWAITFIHRKWICRGPREIYAYLSPSNTLTSQEDFMEHI